MTMTKKKQKQGTPAILSTETSRLFITIFNRVFCFIT